MKLQDVRLGWCTSCGREPELIDAEDYCQACRDKLATYADGRREAARDAFLTALDTALGEGVAREELRALVTGEAI